VNRTNEQIDAGLRSLFIDAAGQISGSELARRRVIDPMPRRSLRPLAAGLAVAVVAGAAGAVLARHVHQATPAGVHHPQVTLSPTPRPTPPTALPLAFPPFFAPDDLTLGAPLAFGHLSLTGADSTLQIGGYKLSVSRDPGSPGTAPVWRIDRSPAPGTATLRQRFAPAATPTPNAEGVIPTPSVSYDPATGQLQYNTGTLELGGASLDAVPTDAADAARLATLFMTQRGLLPAAAGVPQAFSSDQPQEPWGVRWSFHIGDYPVDGPGGRAVMGIGPQGAVADVLETWQPVAGGSSYPVIPWRAAWSQVAAGHWYRECCAFTGGSGPSRQTTFDATSVHLGYIQPDSPVSNLSPSERDFLIPMWVFTDSGETDLFYPAVSTRYLSYARAPQPWPSQR
jgi:hypothetical protein